MYGKIAAVGLGAGLMYLLDPEKGERRRQELSDAACEATRYCSETAEKTMKDARKGFAELQDTIEDWGSSMGLFPKRGWFSRRSSFSINGSTTRWLTGAAGAGLTFYGLSRWTKTGLTMASVGLGLLATGITGKNFIA
jgi:hypothetical protein